MIPLKEHRDVIGLAKCTIPPRSEGEPLFREPWHARIFAVMVSLVKDNRLEWKTFQKRLVSELKEHESPHARLTAEQIDLQYFDCWLEAAEQTLTSSGVLKSDDILAQLEVIKDTVQQIRESQLGRQR